MRFASSARTWRIRAVELLLLAALPAALLVSATPGTASALTTCSVTNTSTTATYGDLQPALDAASEGDTLAIRGRCLGTYTMSTPIDLVGSQGATLDGNHVGTVLTMDYFPTANVSIVGLTITHGTGPYGGGIHFETRTGSLTLRRDEITENSADLEGAGVWFGCGEFPCGSLNVYRTSVTDNSSGPFGGAGAAIHAAGTLTIRDSRVVGNRAEFVTGTVPGGALFVNGSLDLGRTRVDGNSMSSRFGNAGVVYVEANLGRPSEHVTIVNSTVSSNTSTSSEGPVGGALSTDSEEVRIERSDISANRFTSGTGSATGAVVGIGGVTTIGASRITDNVATSTSGDVFGAGVNVGQPMVMTDTTVSGNRALSTHGLARGGGIFAGPNPFYPGVAVTIRRSKITSNRASSQGGGVFVSGVPFGMTGGRITSNRAPIGSALYNDGGTVTLSQVTVTGDCTNC